MAPGGEPGSAVAGWMCSPESNSAKSIKESVKLTGMENSTFLKYFQMILLKEM